MFTPDDPRLFTIPPGEDFLFALAQELAARVKLNDNPEALAETLIYVPNQRSKQALGFALYRASGRNACLLPDIRALGDLETDEPPPSAEAALADLPPAQSPAERLGGLTRLVMAYYDQLGTSIPATGALGAARELARLLDQADLSGDVDWSALDSLVSDHDLQKHWNLSVEFLKIITQSWPAALEDAKASDPYARRFAAAKAMAAAWAENPPQTPVLIAGSTGATPASRLLMQAALTLPQGVVILPGLDRQLSGDILDSIADSPSHPQFTLIRTLAALKTTPDAVSLWPSVQLNPTRTARTRLLHEALAPAANTADWTERLETLAEDGDSRAFVTRALEGLSLTEAEDDADEAMAAAMLLRQTLEVKGETAALITPDAGLARHVSALLKQWDAHVPPSAGAPLAQVPTGSFILHVANWLCDPSEPVKLLAVLRHSLSRFAPDQIDILDAVFLRGTRTWHNFETLFAHIESYLDKEMRPYSRATPEQVSTAQSLIEQVADIVGVLPVEGEPVHGPDWFKRVSHLAEAAAEDGALWRGVDGAQTSKLLQMMADLTEPMGLQRPSVLNELLTSEAISDTVNLHEAHPRLVIWGPLEARLQSADHIILAGLNEGIWPSQPAADAFLPRVFRKQIGLSDPDERIGLSAHDFAQLAAAPRVTILNSKRRDNKPAIASRWIWRLRTLARGALGDAANQTLAPAPENNPLNWIAALQTAPPSPKILPRPAPCPPLDARPKRLSVTRVETLIRDPYEIYARSVLGLYRLDPLNLPPDARIRGTAIHKALERFEEDSRATDPDVLLDYLEQELLAGGERLSDIIALRNRRRSVAAEYILWRQTDAPPIEGKPLLERKGELALMIDGETFHLSGTADRIERRIGGKVAIIDFKSGKPPSEKQVRLGLSPQMPLQGLIARRDGYTDLPTGTEVEALSYIRFGTQFQVTNLGEANSRAKLEAIEIDDLITDAEAGLIDLLRTYRNQSHPYLSMPVPERIAYESDYARLARRDEWLGQTTYD